MEQNKQGLLICSLYLIAFCVTYSSISKKSAFLLAFQNETLITLQENKHVETHDFWGLMETTFVLPICEVWHREK